MSMISARYRRADRALVGLLAAGLACAMLSAPVAAQPDTLEIPNEEFEAFEPDEEGYKPNPLLEPRHPLQHLWDSGDIDMTGTLPDAVMEHVLGASPHAFADAVWEMEVTGSWSQSLSGRGTIQVNEFTEGMGATGTVDLARFTGERGLRTYTARMPLRDDQVFTLAAAFPPTDGDRYGWGSELDGAKSAFWLYACHIFERDRTGCNEDGRDSYYYTDTPWLESVNIVGSRGSYSMRFRARVEEYHYESGPGVVGGIRRTFTGRVGIIRGWICETEAWEADPETCTLEDPLRVTDISPEHGRENVNFEWPTVEWEFSAPVDRDSLEEGFTLTTRDTKGRDIEVAGEIVRQSGNRFSFLPDIDLESGVQYEARIEGGEEGVHARDGDAYLRADHWWRFSTILDLEFQNNSDEEPLEMHIFQTVSDAPLITKKPSVIRINPYWEAHDHIHPDWQPTSFPFTLDLNVVSEAQRRVELQFGGTASTEEIRMRRPDQFNDEHRRLAQHTLNVYGWSPAGQSGSAHEVLASLAAHDPYPTPLDPAELIAERDYEIWEHESRPLVLRYAFLKVGPWADGVPDDDKQIAAAVVREAAEFATQIFPVRDVSGVFTGIAEARSGQFLRPALSLLRDIRSGANEASPDDVFIVFFPPDSLFCGVHENRSSCNLGEDGEPSYCGGGAHLLRSDRDPERGIMLTLVGTLNGLTIPISLQAESLVHELGHHLTLAHRPGNADCDLIDSGIAGQGLYTQSTPLGYIDPEIEGFRIATGGMAGWNKSATEGNAQHPSTLAPLMWPSFRPVPQARNNLTPWRLRGLRDRGVTHRSRRNVRPEQVRNRKQCRTSGNFGAAYVAEDTACGTGFRKRE